MLDSSLMPFSRNTLIQKQAALHPVHLLTFTVQEKMPVHGAELGTEVGALLLQEVTRETLTVQ